MSPTVPLGQSGSHAVVYRVVAESGLQRAWRLWTSHRADLSDARIAGTTFWFFRETRGGVGGVPGRGDSKKGECRVRHSMSDRLEVAFARKGNDSVGGSLRPEGQRLGWR